MIDIRYFCCEGYDWRNSNFEVSIGDCAKSYIILYELESLPKKHLDLWSLRDLGMNLYLRLRDL